ncbi:hypothetical protein F0521_26420 [Ferrimonas sp. YFM]|nr:hypothetical protein F0521_26420 [Ferrimonas sp. YFM]
MTAIQGYSLIIASDVSEERDGIGLELYSGKELVLEIFRDDRRRDTTMSIYRESLPLEVVEKCIMAFKKEIPNSYQD